MVMARRIETAAPPRATMDGRTRRLLEAPVAMTLLRMAWPNVLIMLAQASTGLIETWWVARLGTDALAGMALVFPFTMMMQMISAGAMGGGISAAIARALGRGDRAAADQLVGHAVAICVGFAVLFSAIMLIWGRAIFSALGAGPGEVAAALAYSNVVFAGIICIWVANGLASVVRGTGNMLLPALTFFAGMGFLVVLSPVLIFGFGPIPAMGIAGGGLALVLFYGGNAVVLAGYLLAGKAVVRFRRAPLRWAMLAEILRVGAISSVVAIQTNLVIGGATSLVASVAGVTAVAGYGTGARLEYLLIPIVFGLGAPLVAMVGANIGAGQRARALRAAFTGGAMAFGATEIIGLVAAAWPAQWLRLFSAEPGMIAAGSAYLRIVGPAYGFFGLGLALYFASQGAGRLKWALVGGTLRLVVALGGGWLVLHLGGSLTLMYAALSAGLVLYGATLFIAIARGVWFPGVDMSERR